MNDLPVYFNMLPGQGMAMFRVQPSVKWRFFCIPTVVTRVDFGVSLCSPNDRFDFDHGKTLAWNRLQAFVEGRRSLGDRGLAGTWTMSKKGWQEVVNAGREQEFLLDTMSSNFHIPMPYTWERMVN